MVILIMTQPNENSKPVTAIKRSIEVTEGITLDALEFPDGSYGFTLTSVAKAIGYSKQWISDVSTLKRNQTVKALEGLGFIVSAIGQAVIKESNYKGTLNARVINLEQFEAFLDYGVQQGKSQAIALNKAFRRYALLDLLDATFDRPAKSKAEKLDGFKSLVKQFYSAIAIEYNKTGQWLIEDQEDAEQIEDQQRFLYPELYDEDSNENSGF